MQTNENSSHFEISYELELSLREALSRNAKEEELASILVGAGFDRSAVEDAVAYLQQKRGSTIGAQELDEDELDMVAGGVSSTCTKADDCSGEYKTAYCDTNVYYSNQTCDSWKFCSLSHICDTYSHCSGASEGGCRSQLF